MTSLKEGKKAPAISLTDENGKKHSLKQYQGSWVLLYFYPKDSTPGCTIEALGIKDAFAAYKRRGVVVLGVSTDSEASHLKFKTKHALPFTLLADTEKVVVQKYGVWQEKSMAGKKYMGIVRTSFLIDPEGVIRKVYEKVTPQSHAEEVLADVTALKKAR
jgi:peroxiredoxin Q/BCP